MHRASETPDLPFDVVEAAVTVIGKAFWYKGPLRTLLIRCGVPPGLYDRFAAEPKYVIARHIFDELQSKGDNGRIVALRIVEELCAIRKLPAEVDASAAAKALETLRILSANTRRERTASEAEREAAAAKAREEIEARSLRAQRLDDCKQRYYSLLIERDVQRRGFAFEQLLKDLFHAHEIEYRSSFRTETQQTDGAFVFKSFHYLLEAKWTRLETSLSVLDGFKSKVERKLTSTRGLFVSIAGFSEDVLREFQQGAGRSVILMSGEDLQIILEDRIMLTDALELKTSMASQTGEVYVPLKLHL